VGVPNFNKPLLKNSKGLFLSFNALPAISALLMRLLPKFHLSALSGIVAKYGVNSNQE